MKTNLYGRKLKHFTNFRLFLVAVMLTLNSLAQNETAKWYFGNGIGLNFMTNPPTVLSGAINAWEGCSTISDASGNLLFYTNGITVWNQQHQVMANGTGLPANLSTTQAAVIVKQPGSASFIIFLPWAQAIPIMAAHSITPLWI